MGAVRNLFVRIGGDASGAVKGFKDASRAGANAEKSIKKTSAQTKKSIRETFASSVPSIKEYTAQIAQTKSAHQTASQNVTRLEDEIGRMTGIYDAVKNATEGLNLSKPLSELMVDAEKTLTAIESKRKKLEAELRGLTSDPKTANSKRTAALQTELAQLAEKSRFAQARMEELDRVADAVGSDNMGYASAQGLEQLQQKIQTTKNELATMQQVADETGRSLKSMGVGPYIGQALKGIGKAAAQAAGTGVQKLWGGLKKLGSSAVHGITSLPSKLRNIGRSAASSTGGLTKMVRSIRNISIASLGMRGFGLVFGELRSVITDYLNQNEELNQSIKTMKSQLGEALAPAINIVVVAMQRLMPMVTAVSNGINSIFKALFGDIAATSKKIESASEELNTYGFDQITKESESESDSTSSGASQGGDQSALVTKLTGWLTKLKTAFMAGDWKALGGTFAEGVNSVFSALDKSDIGSKIGGVFNAVTTTLHSLLTGIDFRAIGGTFGRQMTDAFSAIDWNTVGQTIGQLFVMLPSLITGWILGTDWGVVGESLSSMLISTLGEITTWIKETDWLQIGESIATFIASIDWGGIVSTLCEGLGAALAGLALLIWGLIKDAWADVVSWWEEVAFEDGKFTIEGLLRGIGDVFANIGNWLKENVVDPFVNGFKSLFDIHSPSKLMDGLGGHVINGFLGGILDGLSGIGNWIKEHVITPFVNGFKSLRNGVVDVVEGMVNSIIRGINKLLGGLNDFLSLGKKVGLDLSIPTIPEVKLPRAAKGTIVSKATNLTVGEDGTEAIMPLERHTEWIDVLASKLAAKTGGTPGGGGSAIIQIFLGNRKVTEHVIKDINQITRENGVCPIHV